jgi:phosphatidylglycerol:prolipoprotein diacylglycerol transferase
MHRILFEWGPVTVYSYGLMLVVAFLTVTWLAGRTAGRLAPSQRVLTPAQIVDVFCLAMLGGVLGARLFFVAKYWKVFVHQPQEIPAIWHGGLVWYGGFLGGLLAAWIYLRLQRVPFLRAADQCIPFVALAHGIGRIGCFLNGCCYGKPTHAWFGVIVAAGEPARIPTQLLESVALLLFYLMLRWFQERRVLAPAGWLFGAYLVGYAVMRFVIEFLRGDQRAVWAGLTMQQLLSVGVLLVGLVLVKPRRRNDGA